METEAPRSLLVLKPSSFGDIVHTLPAVARLKAAWPKCRISWLANTEWMPLLNGNPDLAEVIEFPRQKFRGWSGAWKAVRWLRTEIVGRRPDLALDFQGLLRSAVIGRTSGARMLMGLSDAREGARWLYHRSVVPPAQPVHAVERYLALAQATLITKTPSNVPDAPDDISFPLPSGQPFENGFDIGEDFVLVHPFARGKYKSLQENDINQLLRRIRTRRILLVGRGNYVIPSGLDRCVNLLNLTTLSQLIWLMRRAAFVVSVDSGPAHLAAALGRPMVAIHAWSDPRKVGPYRPDAWVWKNGTLTQVCNLATMKAEFYQPRPLLLQPTDLDAIARLATSPSDFSA